jgi:hypothetical protein
MKPKDCLVHQENTPENMSASSTIIAAIILATEQRQLPGLASLQLLNGEISRDEFQSIADKSREESFITISPFSSEPPTVDIR